MRCKEVPSQISQLHVLDRHPQYITMIVEGVHGSGKVGSDHSMDLCPISIKGNSANTDSINAAMERSNP